MSEQQYQAEVLDELKMRDLINVCTYCGNKVKENQLSCCGERHFELVENDNERT